jgi:D-lyxose ketol-isomerase
MKRSEINTIMREAQAFIRERGFYLPPFAAWTPGDWLSKGAEAREIVENQLGWDITDFGSGNFGRRGLFMFTIRNGHPRNLAARMGKLYAEKLLISGEGQVTPMHFHWTKMEDIINRGGGRLAIQVYNSAEDESLDRESGVSVSTDGVLRSLAAGSTLRLEPGESITLPPGMYHQFWGEGGTVLVGEVSLVNDDFRDNRFLETVGRFPQIDEDEAPLHLLTNDYVRFVNLSPSAG